MPYYFNLPVITQLTQQQQAAVDEDDSLALSGGPGTGKSVVCLWRHIRNHAIGTKNSLLLTYTKTLEFYLKQSAHSHNILASEKISRVLWWLSHERTKYDEIIVDEGQDVAIGKYERLKNYANEISYGADDAQSLYQEGCSPKDLRELFPANEEYTLYKNFRNSKEILAFTRTVFPDIFIPQNTINDAVTTDLKPIVKVTGWEEKDEIKAIIEIIRDFSSETHNIGVLVPLRKSVTHYYNLLNSELENIECSQYQSEDNFTGLSSVHITTFKSSKGTEFDTVIIPKFDSLDWYVSNPKIPIINEKDYYVAFTRAKRNLFLICKNTPSSGNSTTFKTEYL